MAVRGRKASGTCGSASYVKAHPSTSLKVCSSNFTCKKVEGKQGKYCVAKKPPVKKTRKVLKVSKTGAVAARTKKTLARKNKERREAKLAKLV
jgi:hypothetical protein